MLKNMSAALLLATMTAIVSSPATALQTVVTQVDKNTDGTMTYHFAIKLDQGDSLSPGVAKAKGDFVTVYNFYGLVEGSAKAPAGWNSPRRSSAGPRR